MSTNFNLSSNRTKLAQNLREHLRIFMSSVFTDVATMNSFTKFPNNTTLSMVTFTMRTFVTNPTTDVVNMATFVTKVANTYKF